MLKLCAQRVDGSQMSLADRGRDAEDWTEKGNRAFRRQRWGEAADCYKKALKFIDLPAEAAASEGSKGPKVPAEMRSHKLRVSANLAQVYFKLDDVLAA